MSNQTIVHYLRAELTRDVWPLVFTMYRQVWVKDHITAMTKSVDAIEEYVHMPIKDVPTDFDFEMHQDIIVQQLQHLERCFDREFVGIKGLNATMWKSLFLNRIHCPDVDHEELTCEELEDKRGDLTVKIVEPVDFSLLGKENTLEFYVGFYYPGTEYYTAEDRKDLCSRDITFVFGQYPY